MKKEHLSEELLKEIKTISYVPSSKEQLICTLIHSIHDIKNITMSEFADSCDEAVKLKIQEKANELEKLINAI